MQLQFGIFDYIIIAVFYGLAGAMLILTWLFLRRWKYWPAVIFPLAVVAVVLPWADEVWIAWRFNAACKDAGLHIYRTVMVHGYYDDTGRGTAKAGPVRNPQWIEVMEKAGFSFFEARLLDGRVSHTEKTDGTWHMRVLDRPTARYHYKYADPRQEVSIGYKLEKREIVVIDTESGEVIAREVGYNRYGSWVQKLWIGLVGSDLVQCPDPGQGPPREHLPLAAIKAIGVK